MALRPCPFGSDDLRDALVDPWNLLPLRVQALLDFCIHLHDQFVRERLMVCSTNV